MQSLGFCKVLVAVHGYNPLLDVMKMEPLLDIADSPVTLGLEAETELKILTNTRKFVTSNPMRPTENIYLWCGEATL